MGTTWHAFPSLAPAHMRAWLLHPASLTSLLRQRCAEFAVRPVFEAVAPAGRDEHRGLRLGRTQPAWVREVQLLCDGIPVVFAHSVVAQRHVRGAWRGLTGLGSRSLGDVLFSDPKVERKAFGFRCLNVAHALHGRAAQPLGDSQEIALGSSQGLSQGLWARRSLFVLQGQSILVTEVFLPAVLKLSKLK